MRLPRPPWFHLQFQLCSTLPFLFTHSILLQLLVLPPQSSAFSSRQTDCQANEVFLECGTCEGSCKEPQIANCRKECKPPRCECQAKNGFVRSHDGACILASECGIYRGAYFDRTGHLISKTGASPAAKTMLTHLRPMSGGAGFAPLSQAGGADGGGEGAEGGQEAGEGGGAGDTPFAPPPAPPLPMTAARTPGPPSIRPPFATHQLQSNMSPRDQVIQTGPSPPVLWPPPRREGQAVGRSQMNLFADLANAGVTSNLEEGAEQGQGTTTPMATVSVHHRFRGVAQHQAVLAPESVPRGQIGEARPLGEQEAAASPPAAKCGPRRCPANALATGAIPDAADADESSPQRPSGARPRHPNYHHPYRYALINPPPVSSVGEPNEAASNQLDRDQRQTQRHQAKAIIPPLPAHLRIFRGRRKLRQRK